MSDADTIRRLRAELDEAHETIRQLREERAARADLPEWLPHLTPAHRRILSILSDGRLHSRAQIMLGLYGDAADAPYEKIIDSFVCTLRRRLRPHGLTIETVWGRGWQLTRDSVARLRDDQPSAPALESHHSADQGEAVAA